MAAQQQYLAHAVSKSVTTLPIPPFRPCYIAETYQPLPLSSSIAVLSSSLTVSKPKRQDMLSFLGISSRKSSRRENLDDELNQNLPYPTTVSQTSNSTRSYKTSASQISISAPIPRSNTSLTGFDNPYSSLQAQGSSNELWQFRQPTSSPTRLGASLNPASSSSTSVGRLDFANPPKPILFPHNLPSPPLSDDSHPRSSIDDDPLPAVIRIETGSVTLKSDAPLHIEVPTVRRTVSSPPSPYHHSPGDSSSSSEGTPAFPSGSQHQNVQGGRRWNLKLHTDYIYSQRTQSLPAASSSNNMLAHLRSVGMHHSNPSLAEPNADAFAYAYPYPLVKQLSPIAEQEYFSPESLKRTKSLPVSRSGSEEGLRASAISGGSSLTHSGSPIGSLTSEITRPSPIYPSPFISRPLNRTASQSSSRTHVSATSSGPRQSLKSDNPPMIPPLDLLPTFSGPHPNPSPTGSGTNVRSGKPFANPMPSILGSTEGDEIDDNDEYAGTTDFTAEVESFVTAASDDELGRPRRENSVKDIEIVDKESESLRLGSGRNRGETASVRSVGSKFTVPPPSASESFITRRWDRDVALGPGVPTFRAKKQFINVTPAFWAFWGGFLCPFLWLIGGWHFTHFGEQPPRLTFWEFYFNAGYWKEMCCGGRNKKREMGHLRREGKKVAPPPLPRWVSEKQSSELGRARLNDPKRSLKGISFGYPFISRPVPVCMEEPFLQGVINYVLNILGKPNRIFDHLYGIKLQEVRGRPEGPRRMFDPWIQRCRYALCYAMLLLALGLLSASTFLIVYNTRRLQ